MKKNSKYCDILGIVQYSYPIRVGGSGSLKIV